MEGATPAGGGGAIWNNMEALKSEPKQHLAAHQQLLKTNRIRFHTVLALSPHFRPEPLRLKAARRSRKWHPSIPQVAPASGTRLLMAAACRRQRRPRAPLRQVRAPQTLPAPQRGLRYAGVSPTHLHFRDLKIYNVLVILTTQILSID